MFKPPVKWFVLSVALSLAHGVAIPQEEVPDIAVEADSLLPVPSDQELEHMADYLAGLLREDPWSNSNNPVLYVESMPRSSDDYPDAPAPAPSSAGAGSDEDADEVVLRKRSRYYRGYPWKRVSRTRPNYYDADMFACNPSRHDVLQLLVGLHRAREGEYGRTINFCNRKRPASSVFTNIRFIGKRK